MGHAPTWGRHDDGDDPYGRAKDGDNNADSQAHFPLRWRLTTRLIRSPPKETGSTATKCP